MLTSYSMYQVEAFNNEDVTYTDDSVAVITIAKLAQVTNVKITSASKGTVKATWADKTNTAQSGLKEYKVELLKLNAEGTYDVVKTYTTSDKNYTFADEDIDQTVADTYKVRVTALGTKSYEGTFYADADPVESTTTVVSGSVATVAANGTIYEENNKLYLKVELEDTNNNYDKIKDVVLTSLTDGYLTYSRQATGVLTPASSDEKAYVTFDLSILYGTGALGSGEWTASITVNSKNEALNASTSGQSVATYGIDALDMGELTVNSENGQISWDAVEGATGYTIEVSYDLGQTWTANATATGGTVTYDIDDPTATGENTIEPGRVYTVTVTAYSDNSLVNPSGASATAKLCKLMPATEATVAVDATTSFAKWSKSATASGCIENYLVVAANGTETYSKTTSNGNAAQQNLNVTGLLKNAADGAYTVTVQAKAKAGVAVDGIYYVDSAVTTADVKAYKGTVPAEEIADVSITWGDNSTLSLNYTLPVVDAETSEYDAAMINAIVHDPVTITLYSGDTVLGTYTSTADENGKGTVDITNGTGDLSTMKIGDTYAGQEIGVEFTLTSNYVLIAGATESRSAVVPEQGTIAIAGLTVDYDNGKITFNADPNATQYTAEIKVDNKATDLTVEDENGVKAVQIPDVDAGKDFTVTITGVDVTGEYKTGTVTLNMYKLEDPTISGINKKTGVLTYTVDDTYASKTEVAPGTGAAYDSETKVITYDLTVDAQNVTTTVTSVGGYDIENEVYVLSAENTATQTVAAGLAPDFTMEPAQIVVNEDGTTTVTFVIDQDDPLYDAKNNNNSAVRWANVKVTATSAEGTITATSKSAANGTGKVTATFRSGLLAEGVDYTFELYVPVKPAFKAVAAVRTVVTEPISYNTNAIALTASVDPDGTLTLAATPDNVERYEMTVNGGSTKYTVTNGMDLKDNAEFAAALADGNVQITLITVERCVQLMTVILLH